MAAKDPIERLIERSRQDLVSLETEAGLAAEDLAKAKDDGADFEKIAEKSLALQKAEWNLDREKKKNAALIKKRRDQQSDANKAEVAAGVAEVMDVDPQIEAVHRQLMDLYYRRLGAINRIQMHGGAQVATQFPLLPMLAIPLAGANSAGFGQRQPVHDALENFGFKIKELQRKGITL